MICLQCGFDNPPGAEACLRCRTRLPWPIPPASVQAVPSLSYPTGMPRGVPPAMTKAEGALASLILGSAAVLFCGLLTGIPAVIVGHRAMNQIRRSGGRLQGTAFALPGLVMGYAGCALWLVFIIGGGFLFRNVAKETDASEAGAVKALRGINDAEGSYSRIYTGSKGRVYAGSLAALGAGPGQACAGTGTAEYACLLSGPLSMPDCREPHWCSLNGYRFQLLTHYYPPPRGQDYAITATPTESSGGVTNFCSTSDGIIRSSTSWFALESGFDVEDCHRMKPVTESR